VWRKDEDDELLLMLENTPPEVRGTVVPDEAAHDRLQL
jgi:hypothetical protein